MEVKVESEILKRWTIHVPEKDVSAVVEHCQKASITSATTKGMVQRCVDRSKLSV